MVQDISVHPLEGLFQSHLNILFRVRKIGSDLMLRGRDRQLWAQFDNNYVRERAKGWGWKERGKSSFHPSQI